jgi:tryptophan 7-halogenase
MIPLTQHPQDNSPIENIVIIGADIVAWSAAVGLARGLQGQKITITILDLPTSEAANQSQLAQSAIHCTEHLFDYHHLLGIQDKPLLSNGHMKLCSATQFIDQNTSDNNYFIGFEKAQASYRTVEMHHVLHWLNVTDLRPYSLSALAAEQQQLALPTTNNDPITAGFIPRVNVSHSHYLKFMQGAASHLGITYKKCEIKNTIYHPHTGFIQHFILEDETKIATDLVINTDSEFELFADHQQPYEDCSGYLLFDTKLVANAYHSSVAKPYQQCIASEYGLVEVSYMPGYQQAILHYSSRTTNEQQAKQLVTEILGDINDLHIGKAKFNYSKAPLFKNGLLIGEAASYLGTCPISSLSLSQRSISKLLELFPGKACLALNTQELNRRIIKDHEEALHYSLLMNAYSEMSAKYPWQLNYAQLPASLQHKVSLFSGSGRVSSQLNPFISRNAWIAILKYKVRQRLGYEPVLDALDKQQALQFLHHCSQKIQDSLSRYRPYT